MPFPQLDRFAVRMQPLSARTNKKFAETDFVDPARAPGTISNPALMGEAVERVRAARAAGRPVMAAFGAHSIKNGLAPVFIRLMEAGWLTHLATNGAAIIHDWEFAFQGRTCENVERMVGEGRFGNWQETGYFINLALAVGAFRGLGYGESVGALIEREGLDIPSEEDLRVAIARGTEGDARDAAGAADLLYLVRRFDLKAGFLAVPHPFKVRSVQARAYALGVPFTGHPMIGHDIIYNHPMNQGACIGRAAERDFLAYAQNVSQLDGGVYLSIGSAVMSPMIFEKSLSLSQNLAMQEGRHIDGHYILVVDLAPATWDWAQGEPPEDNPAYYHRYNKTFSRMGGTMRYLEADNRDFLLTLLHELEGRAK
jgi:hypothetical protein